MWRWIKDHVTGGSHTGGGKWIGAKRNDLRSDSPWGLALFFVPLGGDG